MSDNGRRGLEFRGILRQIAVISGLELLSRAQVLKEAGDINLVRVEPAAELLLDFGRGQILSNYAEGVR